MVGSKSKTGGSTGQKTGGQWLTVGSVLKGKKEGTSYVKFKDDVSFSAGTILQVQDPRKRIQDSVDSGRLSAEEGEARLAKIPDFVKYDLILPPN